MQEYALRQNSTRQLAVHAMVDIALRERAGPVPLASMALRLRVSLSSLEQLFSRLRAAGLVASTRGPGGGYRLGRAASAISVASIVSAVDGGARAIAPADDGRPSVANDLWRQLDIVMLAHLAGIALADLLVGQQHVEAPVKVASPRRIAFAPRPQSRPIPANVPNSVFELGAVMTQQGARPGAVSQRNAPKE